MKAINVLLASAALLVAAASCSENESPRNPYVAPYGQFTEAILCTITPGGWISDALGAADDVDSTSFKFLKASFENTLDEAIPASLEDFYLDMKDNEDYIPSVGDVEGMLWTYSRTANTDLLDYALVSFENIDPEACALTEYMKLPILLYGYTGDEAYLNIAYKAEAALDGFSSENVDDVESYAWAMGQFLLTTGHAHWADNIEDAVFGAGEACGDLYRDYVSKMWLTGSHMNEVVAALYGPSTASYKLEDDVEATIVEDTDYPSGSEINFNFSMSKAAVFPFTFRVPAWASEVEVLVNGKPLSLGSSREKWESVSIDELSALEDAVECPECSEEYDYCSDFYTIERKFKTGDVITLILSDDEFTE